VRLALGLLEVVMKHRDKEAYNAYQRQWYKKKMQDKAFKEKRYKRNSKNNLKYKQTNLELVKEFRKNGCLVCQEITSCCLCAHHLDPSSKEFDVGVMINRYCKNRVEAELKKCVCLFHNCHAKLHAGVISLVV
jgi:hypothetical protein